MGEVISARPRVPRVSKQASAVQHLWTLFPSSLVECCVAFKLTLAFRECGAPLLGALSTTRLSYIVTSNQWLSQVDKKQHIDYIEQFHDSKGFATYVLSAAARRSQWSGHLH